MSPKVKWFGVAGVVLVVAALLVVWQLGFLTSEPEEANLADAIEAETGQAPATTSTSATEEAASAAETEPTSNDGAASDPAESGPGDVLAGRWVVKESDATFVGYRIDEVLNGADFTAVGRTRTVSGELEASDDAITSVVVDADLVGLTSDSRFRDQQLKRQALETSKFPDARFELTAPIDVGEIPADGVEASFTATGDLTVHGVTKPVEVAIQATMTGGQLFVVGSTEVALADFDIETPSAPAVASVSDVAIMELSLVFIR